MRGTERPGGRWPGTRIPRIRFIYTVATGPVLMTLIRGGWVIFVLQFLTAPWLVAQDGRPVRAVAELAPHRVIERELGPGQTDEYTVDVKAGQFVRLVARQMGTH